MKIAILGTRYSPPHFRGGEEHIIDYFNTHFRRRNCEVDIYTPKFKKWQQIDDDSTADNVIRVPVSNIRFFYHYQFAARLPRYLKSRRYDVVVNTHSPLGMSLDMGPHVVVINTTCMGEADSVKGFSPKKVIERFMRRTFSLAVERKVARTSQHIVCANHHIVTEVVECLHADPARVTMIGNGVDCDYFCPLPEFPALSDSEPFNVLYVGRLVNRKNAQLLIHTAHQLKTLSPDISRKFAFHIVGYGEERRNLEQLSVDLDVEEMITFYGRQAGQALLDMYQSAHTYILPSRYEGMPLALLEALSCGLPSIVGNFAGADAIITNGSNGFILTDDSAQQCAQYLMQMCQNPRQYAAMRQMARTVILEKFSWDCIIDQYFDVFNEVIHQQSKVS